MWSSPGFTCCEDGIVPTALLLPVVTAEVQGSGNGTVHSSAISCRQGPAWLQVSWRGHWWCLLHSRHCRATPAEHAANSTGRAGLHTNTH